MPRASSRSSSSAESSSWPAASSSCVGRERVLVQLRARQPHVQRHRHEPLLGAVVQVALQPPALLEADSQHALARAAQLLHLRAQLRLEPLVHERERGGGPTAWTCGSASASRVVDDRRRRIRRRARPCGSRGPDRRWAARRAAPEVHVAPAAPAASRRARARSPRAPRRARRAGCPRAASRSRRLIRRVTAPPSRRRARTSEPRKRYGTSANGTSEITNAMSAALLSESADCSTRFPISAIISATPAAYIGVRGGARRAWPPASGGSGCGAQHDQNDADEVDRDARRRPRPTGCPGSANTLSGQFAHSTRGSTKR